MCFRYEQITARSEMQFNQVEGLAVGKNITFADLKGTIADFVRRMFGQARACASALRTSRSRNHPPKWTWNVSCAAARAARSARIRAGLKFSAAAWCILNVLQNGGYDPKVYSGFAWGMGPERQLMLRNKINDIRYFWGNDVRFLEQF
jgi:phenylalanyl-tRNA synthetase alpha chain